MAKKWLWGEPSHFEHAFEESRCKVEKGRLSMGIGHVICGADSELWGRVVDARDAFWILEDGARVRKDQMGVTWRWQDVPLPDVVGAFALKPSARPRPFKGHRAEHILKYEDRKRRLRNDALLAGHVVKETDQRSTDSSSSDDVECKFPAKTIDETTPCLASKGLVRVKKHSSMGCAIVTLSSDNACDSILKRGQHARGRYLHAIANTSCEFRRNSDKETGSIIPCSLFVAWGHQGEKSHSVSAQAIADYVHGLLIEHVVHSGMNVRNRQLVADDAGEDEKSDESPPPTTELSVVHPSSDASSCIAQRRRNPSRGASVSRALDAARDILKKRCEKERRSVSRRRLRHTRSASRRRNLPEEEIFSDAEMDAEKCLRDIGRRSDLLASLHENFNSWAAIAKQIRHTQRADPNFDLGSEVRLYCFCQNADLVWSYDAKVVDADCETVELLIDGGDEIEAIDWDYFRRGMLTMKPSSASHIEISPLNSLRDALHGIVNQRFECSCCADDQQEVIHACSCLQKSMDSAAISLGSLHIAFACALKLQETLLRWTSESLSVCLPVSEVAYTHDRISNRFRHGDLDPEMDPLIMRGPCGKSIDTLVRDLIEGKSDPLHDPDLELEAVFYHGRYRSINNRRLWALKQYSEHCDCDIKVKVRAIALLPEAKMRNGRLVLPKFFDANQSANNGDEVGFRGVPPPMVQSSRRILDFGAVVQNKEDIDDFTKWLSILNGKWVDESGDPVGEISNGEMKTIFFKDSICLRMDRGPWPISCVVAGEWWRGACFKHGEQIFWESGDQWNKLDEPHSSDDHARILVLKLGASTYRDFTIATSEFLGQLQLQLDLDSGRDFSHRIVPHEKCLLLAFAEQGHQDQVQSLLGVVNIGCSIHAERLNLDDMSKDVALKVQGLESFLQC